MRCDRTSRFIFASCVWIAVSWGADQGWGHGAELSTAEELTSAVAVDGFGASAIKRLESKAPKKVYDLLARLRQRQGEPLPGYVGGRTFQNRERRLPQGLYREYDVNAKIRGRPRDAERLVIEQHTGKAYYSKDHYRTFILLE